MTDHSSKGWQCPICRSRTGVIDSRVHIEQGRTTVTRRRACVRGDCEYRVSTIEVEAAPSHTQGGRLVPRFIDADLTRARRAEDVLRGLKAYLDSFDDPE